MSNKIYAPTSFSQHYKKLEKEESGSFGVVYKVSNQKCAAAVIDWIIAGLPEEFGC